MRACMKGYCHGSRMRLAAVICAATVTFAYYTAQRPTTNSWPDSKLGPSGHAVDIAPSRIIQGIVPTIHCFFLYVSYALLKLPATQSRVRVSASKIDSSALRPEGGTRQAEVNLESRIQAVGQPICTESSVFVCTRHHPCDGSECPATGISSVLACMKVVLGQSISHYGIMFAAKFVGVSLG